MHDNPLKVALEDIIATTRRYPLIAMLGWQDVRQRYRRSALGPFWLTISMGVMIGTIGVVFGQIFNSPMDEYLPFLAVGMILWGFISTVVTEGCVSFIAAEGIIRQLPIPLFVHVLRIVWRNFIILCHNLIILPLVFMATDKSLDWVIFLSIPGLLILTLNLVWVVLLLGVLCARYRDLSQIVGSILQIAFYLTPIMWVPSLLPERAGLILLSGNPIFHLMEVVRAPLLGAAPSIENWVFSSLLAIVGWSVTLIMYGLYKRRIAYWL